MDESEYDINRRLDKTYMSPSLPSFGDKTRKVRIASKAFQSPDDYAFATIKDEVVLRHKEGAKKTVKAKFMEDSRGVFVLNIQGFSAATDKPHNASFAFIGDEIRRLIEFLKHIQTFVFENDKGVNITDDELRKLAVSGKQVALLLKENPDVIAEVLRTEITKEDIVAIGYRKKQLDTFCGSGLWDRLDQF